MATITGSVDGGNWSSGLAWVGGVAPTSGDDVVLNASSGDVTIDSGAACRSLDCTGYLGQLYHSSAVTLSIGSSSAGASGVALVLSGGYTLGNASSSAIRFVSSSSTQQSITTAGKTLGNVTFDGAGGSWKFLDSFSQGSSAVFTLTRGSVDANGQNVSVRRVVSNGTSARALTTGAGTWTLSSSASNVVWDLTATGMTFNGHFSTIVVSDGANAHTFNGGGLDYGTLRFTGTGAPTFTLTGGNSFGGDLDLECTTALTVSLPGQGRQTVSGTLTLKGASGQVLSVSSDIEGYQSVVRAATIVEEFDSLSDDILLIAGLAGGQVMS